MPVNKQATLVSTSTGCFFTRVKHAFLPLGSFRQNAPPSLPRLLAVPDQRCHSASLRAFTPVFNGLWTRVNALMASLSLALHRIRGTQASDGFANPIHFSNSPSHSCGTFLRPGFATKRTNLLAQTRYVVK